MQISDVEALDTDRALQAIMNGSRLSSVASLQLLVRLLHGVRPDWVSSFSAFRRWQAYTVTLLSRILRWSTTAYRLNQVMTVYACHVVADGDRQWIHTCSHSTSQGGRPTLGAARDLHWSTTAYSGEGKRELLPRAQQLGLQQQ